MVDDIDAGVPTTATVTRSAKLSDAALILLAQAGQREDGMVLPPPATLRARGKALENILRALLKAGFVVEVAVGSGDQAWRQDEGRGGIGLRVTAAGLAALGMGPAEQQRVDVADSVGSVPERADPDSAGPLPPAPHQPKTTKKDQLLSLLAPEPGASIADLSMALNWQAHTVRAALTRLRQAGHALVKTRTEDGETRYRVVGSVPSGTDQTGSETTPADAGPNPAAEVAEETMSRGAM